MKRILSMLLMTCLTIGMTLAQNNKPEMTFESLTHDFGTFKEADGPVTCVFKFKNTGKGVLVIYQAVASCGCTTPVYTKEPIKPGESGEIKVTYNGAGRSPGRFDKYVTLRTNTKAEIVRLKIKGTMIGK